MTKDLKYSGVWPVAPTPFHDDGSLDLEGMKRILDCMVDQGVDGICILANFSEQFLLSDEERDILTRLCLEHVVGRYPDHGAGRAVIRSRAAFGVAGAHGPGDRGRDLLQDRMRPGRQQTAGAH